MSDTFIHDPDEKYEFLIRPLDGNEVRVWQECTQSDYYAFGQVVPVRITVPNKEGGERMEMETEGHYPVLARCMVPVQLFDEKEIEDKYQREHHFSPTLNKSEWETVWAFAVETIEAKLPMRLKKTLFKFK